MKNNGIQNKNSPGALGFCCMALGLLLAYFVSASAASVELAKLGSIASQNSLNNGTIIAFDSTPRGAHIYANQQYLGTTPLEFAAEKGRIYKVSVGLRGYKTETFYVDAANSINASVVLEPNRETFALNLSPGWNFISVPLESVAGGKPALFNSTCAGIRGYAYDGIKDNFIERDFSLGGFTTQFSKGYAVYSYSAAPCTLSFVGNAKVSRLTETKLYAGYNFFGAPAIRQTWQTIRRDCKTESGPYAFDKKKQRYVRSDWIEPGQAYLVKVKEDCAIASLAISRPGAGDTESQERVLQGSVSQMPRQP